jgi:hypothetical protein
MGPELSKPIHATAIKLQCCLKKKKKKNSTVKQLQHLKYNLSSNLFKNPRGSTDKVTSYFILFFLGWKVCCEKTALNNLFFVISLFLKIL